MDKLMDFFDSDQGHTLLVVLVTALFIFGFSKILKRLIPRYISNTSSQYKTRKFINFIAFCLLIVALLLAYSNKLTGFAVFLGVAGAGIAFALQEVIAAVASFIIIQSTGLYKVGDRIEMGGIKGDVVDIGFLRTTLMEMGAWVSGDVYNGRITTVSNNSIFKEAVYNYSGEFPFLWDEVNIPIRHESDFEFARSSFLKILEEVQGKYEEEAKIHWNKMTGKLMVEKAKIEPQVSLMFDENWITFNLRYVVDYKKRGSTKDAIFTRILRFINDSEGRVQFASTSMEITAFPDSNSE